MRVFGYGSLARRRDVVLDGWERWWGVAMDNRLALPGYKRYRDAAGSVPPLHVAFADLRPAPGASVRGDLLEVSVDDLAALDRRERNYLRVPLPALGEDVWAYIGSPEARARAATAREAGTLVLQRAYLELCGGGPDPAELPVLDLERVDLP